MFSDFSKSLRLGGYALLCATSVSVGWGSDFVGTGDGNLQGGTWSGTIGQNSPGPNQSNIFLGTVTAQTTNTDLLCDSTDNMLNMIIGGLTVDGVILDLSNSNTMPIINTTTAVTVATQFGNNTANSFNITSGSPDSLDTRRINFFDGSTFYDAAATNLANGGKMEVTQITQNASGAIDVTSSFGNTLTDTLPTVVNIIDALTVQNGATIRMGVSFMSSGNVQNYLGTATVTGVNSLLDLSNGGTTGKAYNFISGDLSINSDGTAMLSSTGNEDVANHIKGDLIINTGTISCDSGTGSGTVINTIDGAVNITNGGQASFLNPNTTNTISSGVTVNGTNSGVIFSFAETTITGGLTVQNNGSAGFAGATNTTIDTVTLSYGGSLLLGGSTGDVSTGPFTWNDGTVEFVYLNGGFGSTTFDSVTFNSGSHNVNVGSIFTSPTVGSYKLFTVSSSGISANSMTLTNNIPLLEAPGNGLRVIDSVSGGVGAKDVMIDFVQASTTSGSQGFAGNGSVIDTVTTIQDAVNTQQKFSMGDSSAAFTGSSYSLSQARFKLMQAMRANKQNPLEAALNALTESGQEATPLVKQKGDYRLWLAPYSVYVRNTGTSGSGSAFTERDYGMLFGASHYLKGLKTNVSGLFGVGLINQQMDVKAASKTTGKQYLMGITAVRNFFEKYEVISSLFGIMSTRNQSRQGNPSPTQSYVARANYNTYALSFQSEVGRVFKLKNDWSVRPSVGLQLLASRRSGFSERDAGTFAQTYRTKDSKGGEAFTGLGFRKKWAGDRYEGKITTIYQVGQKSGNGRDSTTVYAGSSSIVTSVSTPGRFTQYFNIYGSVLDKETNWKIIPGAMVTLQKGQRSLTTSLKFEKRF